MQAIELAGERVVRPWRETTLLATGASQGIGHETAAFLLAETDIRKIYIGSRSLEGFKRAVEGDKKFTGLEQRVPGFDPHRVAPFIADFSHPGEATAQYKAIHDEGDAITDILYFAAGGMEGVLNRVGLRLRRLSRVPQTDPAYQPELDSINEAIAAGVKENKPYAQAVNFRGPAELHRFVSVDGGSQPLPEGSMQIDETSLWATFLRNVPTFYKELIAKPKHEFEDELDVAGEFFALHEEPYYFGKVSGGIVLDTLVGTAISNFIAPLIPDLDQAKLKEYAVLMKDMALANRIMLEDDPQTWVDNFRTLYVYGEDGQVHINNTLIPSHPMFDIQMPI
ncbi:hypothetical protein HY025_02880 [Candidatus Daviesbacteria bacterium]|nr:hypothetical protein [Candidatus Daviesbacteria bacterium]